MDRIMTGRLLAALVCVAASIGTAPAQALRDPTLPPTQRAPAGSGAAASEAALPVLQSVLIGRQPGGRKVAVIDGQTVRVGEKFKGAILTSVSDNQAVLLRGGAKQVLRLYPAAEHPSSLPR
jgi:MSHA biogenesis protein MshK